jgi:ATP-dependent Clp protease ATP-binding subunit ClpA
MFKRIKLRFGDIKTIGKLIPGADKQANMLGEEKPGAEHFLLSALDLKDGTAKRVFDRVGIDTKKYRDAIKAQYDEALRSVGISHKDLEIDHEPIESDRVLHDSQPSGQNLMKSLYALKKQDKDLPLLGAHIIIVAAAIEYGVVPRVFKVLGVDRDLLAKAAREEIDSLQR